MDKKPSANAGVTIWSLVQEDSTYCRATKPTHNFWAFALEPPSHNHQVCKPQFLSPTCPRAQESTATEPMGPEPVLCNEKPLQWEASILKWRVAPAYCNERKPVQKQWRPCAAKKKKKVNTIQSNPQIQCNPYQISNGILKNYYLQILFVYLFIFGCAVWMKSVPPAVEVWSPNH